MKKFSFLLLIALGLTSCREGSLSEVELSEEFAQNGSFVFSSDWPNQFAELDEWTFAEEPVELSSSGFGNNFLQVNNEPTISFKYVQCWIAIQDLGDYFISYYVVLANQTRRIDLNAEDLSKELASVGDLAQMIVPGNMVGVSEVAMLIYRDSRSELYAQGEPSLAFQGQYTFRFGLANVQGARYDFFTEQVKEVTVTANLGCF